MKDLDALKGEVRQLTQDFKAGTPGSFQAFRDLTQLLLGITIAEERAHIVLTSGPNKNRRVLAAPHSAIPLRDGRYLRLSAVLELVDTADGWRMKVMDSSYVYQTDADGEKWILRYEYLRDPKDQHPGAHVHINAKLSGEDDCCPSHRPLPRIHFPTGRISLEAVIRLLADQFELPCATDRSYWRAVLAESERAFLEIAHKPLSGPAALVQGETD